MRSKLARASQNLPITHTTPRVPFPADGMAAAPEQPRMLAPVNDLLRGRPPACGHRD
jgi:hypothetical protein